MSNACDNAWKSIHFMNVSLLLLPGRIMHQTEAQSQEERGVGLEGQACVSLKDQLASRLTRYRLVSRHSQMEKYPKLL